MDSKLIEWSKTILVTHALTPRLLCAITKENEKMMSIGYGSRHFEIGLSTYDFLDKMLTLNLMKRNLTILHEDVKEILGEIDDVNRDILISRFLKRKAVTESLPNMNIRTAYRHYNNAIKLFAKGLTRKGYDVDKLESMLSSNKVVMAIHRSVKSHSIMFRSDKPDINVDTKPISNMQMIANIMSEDKGYRSCNA